MNNTIDNYFEKLFTINVNEKTEKKEGLTYLSWAWAWAEFKKVYPTATYSVKKNEQGLPYFYSAATGYMCYTEVSAGGLTYEMWLPVMDSKNKAMKNEPYSYKASNYEKTVLAATMFDVNKTIMRCLVKNLAMFGLGLYIYAGEDLPEIEAEQPIPPIVKPTAQQIAKLIELGGTIEIVATYFKTTVDEVSGEQVQSLINQKLKTLAKKENKQ